MKCLRLFAEFRQKQKFQVRVLNFFRNNYLELFQNKLEINDRVIYTLYNKEAVIIKPIDINNNVTIKINDEIITTNIKNIESVE